MQMIMQHIEHNDGSLYWLHEILLIRYHWQHFNISKTSGLDLKTSFEIRNKPKWNITYDETLWNLHLVIRILSICTYLFVFASGKLISGKNKNHNYYSLIRIVISRTVTNFFQTCEKLTKNNIFSFLLNQISSLS